MRSNKKGLFVITLWICFQVIIVGNRGNDLMFCHQFIVEDRVETVLSHRSLRQKENMFPC